MNADNSTISNLHHAYRTLTGMAIGLDMHRERVWYEWIRAGHTQADLALVVAHLKKGIYAGERRPACLKFSNLIASLDYFGEDLALAKALARKPQVDPGRVQVLKATQRTTQPPTAAPRSAYDVLRASEAFKAFQDLKKSL